jgi:hypothetical protein
MSQNAFVIAVTRPYSCIAYHTICIWAPALDILFAMSSTLSVVDSLLWQRSFMKQILTVAPHTQDFPRNCQSIRNSWLSPLYIQVLTPTAILILSGLCFLLFKPQTNTHEQQIQLLTRRINLDRLPIPSLACVDSLPCQRSLWNKSLTVVLRIQDFPRNCKSIHNIDFQLGFANCPNC